MKRFLVDMSHTAHSSARTGVQRVTRSLVNALGDEALPITFDPYLESWRGLQAWETGNLAGSMRPGPRRGATWPWWRRWQSRWEKTKKNPGVNADTAPAADGLIVPEIFSRDVARALRQIFPQVRGPRVAVFHDAIALQFPELSPTGTVARFPAYLQELLFFDGIAAVSESSRRSLLEYWRWLEILTPPPVTAIPLGIDIPAVSETSPARHVKGLPALPGGRTSDPVVLCVGTLEGRKNHLSLLDAAEKLWTAGEKFSLRLIGMAHQTTGAAALARVQRLRNSGQPIVYDGPASEAELDQAYRGCTFTVYPSWQEGFGLPVLESLVRGKACICSSHGALGEAAQGGGCLTLDRPDAGHLAHAIRRLLREDATRLSLEAAAQARKYRSWNNYAGDLTTWMCGLARRELG